MSTAVSLPLPAEDRSTLVPERDAQGQLTRLTVTVTDEFAARRLAALLEVTLSRQPGWEYPYFVAWELEEATWLVTASGNAGRLTATEDGARFTLDDGLGRALLTLRVEGRPHPASDDPLPTVRVPGEEEAVLRAARFLHAESTGEAACLRCGCTDTWGCAEGCAWAAQGLCDACEGEPGPTSPDHPSPAPRRFRVTPNLLKVLCALADTPEEAEYGLSLSRRTGLTAGHLYPILKTLAEHGHTHTWKEEIDERAARRPSRHYHQITAQGRGFLDQERRKLGAALQMSPDWDAKRAEGAL